MKEHKACAIRNNLTDKDIEFIKKRLLKTKWDYLAYNLKEKKKRQFASNVKSK